MNRCLNERTLLRVYTHESTAAEQSHLRLCADCAEHYDQLVEDLAAIGHVLESTPPALETRRGPAWRVPWIPVAVAGAALLVVVLDAAWLRRSSPVQMAMNVNNVSAFATDLSNALFATSDADTHPQMIAETSYLDAALDAGRPCTQDQFLTSDCDDQLSALMIEGE